MKPLPLFLSRPIGPLHVTTAPGHIRFTSPTKCAASAKSLADILALSAA
jgi:hypothetical protein